MSSKPPSDSIQISNYENFQRIPIWLGNKGYDLAFDNWLIYHSVWISSQMNIKPKIQYLTKQKRIGA